MTAPNYPNNPTVGQDFTLGLVTYRWDGEKWNSLGGNMPVAASQVQMPNGSNLSDLGLYNSSVVVGGVQAGDLGQHFMRRRVFSPLLASNTAAQNSAILQSKIDYANSQLDAGFNGGLVVCMPEGSFDFEGVEVKRGMAGLSGAGLTATVLNLVGANKKGLHCAAAASGLAANQVDFGFFEGFTIQPKTPNLTVPVNQVMWDAIGFSRWRIEDVYFGWCGGAVGIRAIGGAAAELGGPANWHNTFINVYVQRAASWPAGGIGWLLGDTSLTFEQITTWAITGGRTSGGDGNGVGLNIQSCNTLVFYKHAIEGCDIVIGNHSGGRIAENVCFIPAYWEGSNTATIGTKASNTSLIGEFITGYTIVDTSGTLNRLSPTSFQTRCGHLGGEDWLVNITNAFVRRPKYKGGTISGVDFVSDSGTISFVNSINVNASYEAASFYSGNLDSRLVGFGSNGMVLLTDGLGNIGSPPNRCDTVYAVTGTISTSDERSKTKLLAIEEAEKAAALEIKANIRKFKMLDAVALKREDARIHFGVGAQTVHRIMEDNGLDPHNYAFFCFDEWEAQLGVIGGIEVITQKAGNRYGIRYDELAMFILAAI